MPATVFSAAPDYYNTAVTELRRAFDVDDVTRVGPDAGLVELPQAELAQASQDGHLRFIRHLAAVDELAKSREFDDDEAVARWSLEAVADELSAGDQVSLHVWDSGTGARAPGTVRRPLLAALKDAGVEVVTSGTDRTVSVCLGSRWTTAGLGPSSDGLIDWAGGRIRLANRREQISRAEFKLEELFSLIDAPTSGVAIDLGASPGGWTRILRTRGVASVHAVDPADLDERLASDAGVRHHRTTAGDFLRRFDEPVDLIVNDMRMDPDRTARTMVDAAKVLKPQGLAIMTLKLGRGDPIYQSDDAIGVLRAEYDPVFVRQLQHNRSELTVVARPRG